MTVDESWQNHAIRSHNCKQIWRALRSAISVAFEILDKKMRVEDTEAYQEMMAVNYKKFWEILTTILAIKPLVISVWARF